MKNENHPISACLAPMKADAMQRAEKDALEYIERFKKAFDEAGRTLEAYAPNAAHNRQMYEKRQRAYALIQSDKPTWNFGEKMTYHVCPDLEKRFVKDAIEGAAAQYDLFVMKLIGKVGAVQSAEIEGNHIWGHSILTVMKRNGAELYGERWKTQQIVNVSSLGKLFNQWPSRKIK